MIPATDAAELLKCNLREAKCCFQCKESHESSGVADYVLFCNKLKAFVSETDICDLYSGCVLERD